ncbi:MAG: DMT family transporter [Lachnospiraceae bacterium]|nr:DMT family transporter [Lachnospiraceae bacterium]
MWIVLVLIYGILKGVRDIAKKKALTKNGVTEVLFVYTLLAFAFVLPEIPRAGGVPLNIMLMVAFKSFIIFIAFLCSFHAIEKMPVSLYGVLDLSRMIFAMVLGVTVLKESLGLFQILGMLLVMAGLMLLRFKPDRIGGNAAEKAEPQGNTHKALFTAGSITVILAFVSTFLNAVSGMLDKMIMSTGKISDGQLQFWYMLFMVVYYGLYVIFTKTKITAGVWKNPYVWLIAILFIIADRCLFIANGDPASKVTVMTLLKQVCCVVTIIGGRIVFKEKNIGYKLFCAAVVISGIVLAAIRH